MHDAGSQKICVLVEEYWTTELNDTPISVLYSFLSSLLLVKMKIPMARVRQELPLWSLMLSNVSCQEDISSPIFRW